MNLPIRLAELTRTPVNFDESREPNHVVIQATEPELFKCPFVMITEVGVDLLRRGRSEGAARLPAKGRLHVGRRLLGLVRVEPLGARAAQGAAGQRVSDHRRADEPLDLPHAVRLEAFSADSVDRMGLQRHRRRSAVPTARPPTPAPSSMRRDASSCSSRTTPTSATRTSASPTIRRTSTIFRWKATRSGSTSCCTR